MDIRRLFLIIFSTVFIIMINDLGFAFTSPSVVSLPNLTTIHFLILSDIHFDPFTSCTKIKPCPLIQKLQHAPVSRWASLLAQFDTHPPQYRLNSNYALLTSTLQSAKYVAKTKNIQFVLVLGDFLGHRFKYYYQIYSADKTQNGYISFVRKTFAFLTTELGDAFSTQDVYLVVGNHDTYQKNYFTVPGGLFLKDTAVLWSKLIKNPVNRSSMQTQFRNAGYYALSLPQSNLRLIILNTNLFSIKVKEQTLANAATQQLNWFHKQLQSAKEKNQKILIGMHIPTTLDFYLLNIKLFNLVELWKKSYRQRFETVLKPYAMDIVGIFTGHLHIDWLQMLTLMQTKQIPTMSVPSVSPIYGNNPSFKVFSYTLQPLQLQDDSTYYYLLGTKKIWESK